MIQAMPTIPNPSQPQLLERIATTIGELPTSPTVVSAVMGLTADLNTEIKKLSRALSADPALTAKVLRISNSPFYGRARSVSSLDEAVMILGFFTIRSLVVATSAYSMFKRGGGDGLEHGLWEHSLATAMGARITARRLGLTQVDEVFLAGLLHDIGILILAQKMPRDYRDVLAKAGPGGSGLLDLENGRFGFTHAELGAIMLERWNFPPVLVEMVRYHHDPEAVAGTTAAVDGELLLKNTLIVRFADELAQALGHDITESSTTDPVTLAPVAALELSADSVADISVELTERFAEEQSLFEG